MKPSGSVVAFVLSAAIHACVLSSNLFDVSAKNEPENRTRPVRIQIVPRTVTQPRVPIEKKPQAVEPEAPERNVTAQPEAVRLDVPVEKASSPEPVPEENLPEELPPLQAYSESIPDLKPLIPSRAPEFDMPAPEVTLQLPEPDKIPAGERIPYGSSLDIGPAAAASASIPGHRGEGAAGGGTGLKSPAIINFPSRPEYPRYSRLHREEGTTELSVEILSDGNPGRIEVIRSSGYRRLDEAAVKGVRKAELIPAVIDGRNVTSMERITIRFDLEDWGD